MIKNLVEFEKEFIKNNNDHIPNTNSIWNIGNGQINLLCKTDNEYDLFTYSGTIQTGEEEFVTSYKSLIQNITVIQNTTLEINNKLSIKNSSVNIYGNLKLLKDSTINIEYGLLKLNSKSIIYLTEPNIKFELNSSRIRINGRIIISFDNLSLLENKNIIINPSCEINVIGINYPERIFSVSDYELSLRNKIINPYTNGEFNNEYGRIGYTWIDGNLKEKSQILRINILYGDAILGDFKFRTLGLQSKLVSNRQFVSDIYVSKRATLYISDNYKGFTYYNPELYLGFVLFNFKRAAKCIISGSVIVDGSTAKISIDIESSIHIRKGAKLILRNNSKLINSNEYNKNKCIFIDGELIIENIEQLVSFYDSNFVLGDTGKIIILNPDNGNRKLLLSIPNGILTSELYRLFKDYLNQIEYHISNNNGIIIDEYFDFYSNQMTKWYNNMRIEKAIYNKLIVWHDGGFIELNNSIIPWVDTNCTLLQASRIFKSSGSYDNEKLQEVVEHLLYAGCGDIIFRFVKDDEFKDVRLNLKPIKINNIYNKPLTDSYIVECDESGDLFIKNKIYKTTSKNIINETSKHILLNNGKTEFQL